MSGILVADIGGTNSRLALVNDRGTVMSTEHYRNADFADFDAILRTYLDGRQVPDAGALAVAGPVTDNAVTMTNLGWRLAGDQLAREHGMRRVEIINDFAALAWATTCLGEQDLAALGGGVAEPGANRGIIGPGTGLGVSGLVRGASDWVAVAGEGGHVSLPAYTSAEVALIQAMTEKHGHCSAERLLSGPGLIAIYEFLGGVCAEPVDVTRRARDGESLALETIGMFGAMLGTVAANLALTLGASGGIYLAGGMLPDMLDLFSRTPFRERFEAKGRFRDYLAAIPTVVITARDPSLAGIAAYVMRNPG